jgi:hypothetical protein
MFPDDNRFNNKCSSSKSQTKTLHKTESRYLVTSPGRDLTQALHTTGSKQRVAGSMQQMFYGRVRSRPDPPIAYDKQQAAGSRQHATDIL